MREREGDGGGVDINKKKRCKKLPVISRVHKQHTCISLSIYITVSGVITRAYALTFWRLFPRYTSTDQIMNIKLQKVVNWKKHKKERAIPASDWAE